MKLDKFDKGISICEYAYTRDYQVTLRGHAQIIPRTALWHVDVFAAAETISYYNLQLFAREKLDLLLQTVSDEYFDKSFPLLLRRIYNTTKDRVGGVWNIAMKYCQQKRPLLMESDEFQKLKTREMALWRVMYPYWHSMDRLKRPTAVFTPRSVRGKRVGPVSGPTPSKATKSPAIDKYATSFKSSAKCSANHQIRQKTIHSWLSTKEPNVVTPLGKAVRHSAPIGAKAGSNSNLPPIKTEQDLIKKESDAHDQIHSQGSEGEPLGSQVKDGRRRSNRIDAQPAVRGPSSVGSSDGPAQKRRKLH